MLRHLRNECTSSNHLECPNKCQIDEKYCLAGLREHLIEECPGTLVECVNCYTAKTRKTFEKHDEKTCIHNLQAQLRVLKHHMNSEGYKRQRLH